jgi:hypothetical protein
MIKVALNTTHRNKPPDTAPQEFWREFNGAFHNYSLPLREFQRAIKQGCAYTTWHTDYRKRANFVLGQHFGLDFDGGVGLGELLSSDFITSYASFIHTTPSHTRDNPHFRVIFIIKEPLIISTLYSAVAEQLVLMFELSDQKCKDPARVFFGSENCEIVTIGQIMTVEVLGELIKRHEKEMVERRARMEQYFANRKILDPRKANGQFTGLMNNFVQEVLIAPDGMKHTVLTKMCYTLGGYVASGYVDRETAVREMQNAILSRPTVANKPLAIRTVIESISAGMKSPLLLTADPLDEMLFH